MEFKHVENVATAIDEIISNSFYVLKCKNVNDIIPYLAERNLKWFGGNYIKPNDTICLGSGRELYVAVCCENDVRLLNTDKDSEVVFIIDEPKITINDKAYTDEDKAIECIRNFFHPFPSIGDTIFWVSAGGVVKKDTFRDNVFCKRIKELGNYYKTAEEAKIIADKLKEVFKK